MLHHLAIEGEVDDVDITRGDKYASRLPVHQAVTGYQHTDLLKFLDHVISPVMRILHGYTVLTGTQAMSRSIWLHVCMFAKHL